MAKADASQNTRPDNNDAAKIKAYEDSFLADYRENVANLTFRLKVAQDLLAMAEDQRAAGKPVTSMFARRWRL